MPRCILLIGTDYSLFSQVNELYGKQCVLRQCKNTADALSTLDDDPDIAVVILDVVFERKEIADFLLVMRRRYSNIPTIALSKIGETTVIIALVEQSLVYRYLPKPVKSGLLRISIASALEQSEIDIVSAAPQIPQDAISELSPLAGLSAVEIPN